MTQHAANASSDNNFSIIQQAMLRRINFGTLPERWDVVTIVKVYSVVSIQNISPAAPSNERPITVDTSSSVHTVEFTKLQHSQKMAGAGGDKLLSTRSRVNTSAC
jgi:hypothetical protein